MKKKKNIKEEFNKDFIEWKKKNQDIFEELVRKEYHIFLDNGNIKEIYNPKIEDEIEDEINKIKYFKYKKLYLEKKYKLSTYFEI